MNKRKNELLVLLLQIFENCFQWKRMVFCSSSSSFSNLLFKSQYFFLSLSVIYCKILVRFFFLYLTENILSFPEEFPNIFSSKILKSRTEQKTSKKNSSNSSITFRRKSKDSHCGCCVFRRVSNLLFLFSFLPFHSISFQNILKNISECFSSSIEHFRRVWKGFEVLTKQL